tara:strand:- start:403 stop:546 length:144 start_codon:yes stop_codon:yes gene_type:complete
MSVPVSNPEKERLGGRLPSVEELISLELTSKKEKFNKTDSKKIFLKK